MNLYDFHFIRPLCLLTLLPYGALVFWLFKKRLNQSNWTSICDAELLPFLLQHKPSKQSRSLLLLGAIAAGLAIIALAGPSWQRSPAPAFRNASALVIALDLSRSMDAEDIKPSRLVRARYKIADMLRQRKDGQTALLVYGGDAFTVTPLTDDIATITNQLSALSTDILPSPGSHAGKAINKAIELCKQAGLQKGHIILVTDEIDDSAFAAIENLGALQLSVLGVGTEEGAPIPALEGGGFVKDAQGAIVMHKLNPVELARLASAGHGTYQTLSANESDIQTLLAATNQPEIQSNQQNDDLMLDQWQDQGPWFLLGVLPLAALLFRRGILVIALWFLLPLPRPSYALEWQDAWQTRDQRAQEAFNQQKYQEAAELFENPDWKAAAYYKANQFDKALTVPPAQTSDSFYNQGNALAQSGQLDAAIKAYEQALKLNPDNSDAQFNKELVEKERDKQKQQQQNQEPKDKNQPQNQQEQNQGANQPRQSEKNAGENNKPEQKTERNENPEIPEQQNEKQTQQPKPQPDNKEQPQQQDEKPQQSPKPVGRETQETDEQQQANEQWLKRIPDDPAGLLRRKFKYQYGQRQPPNQESENW